MAYRRKRTEERTGYQTGDYLLPSFDNQCDFVMVYRLNESTAERIKMYRDRGYVVHLMTGISWGHYIDYLYGEYDGVNHWDEAQTDRNGNIIAHGVDVPYMVPTVAFSDYLTEKLKTAVDCGVEAIHVEEPEFWDRAGYSEGFKREFKIYYGKDWTPPHESADARYKCARLKAYLYTRTIDRVSSALKEYALSKYGRTLRFYVPTHSLLNYTQWKIVSPEGKLSDIACVDGCIAQVWTGTARESNWYEGVFKERTFETAYLEYGVMQELVKGTGRKMWFLHDPIEDNPIFDWNDYQSNYFCTVAASLLHPKVNTYEICPWPNRVFENKYPSNSPDAKRISPEYRTMLNNMFQTLGTIENEDETEFKVGILMSDGQLYQREYPDCEFSTAADDRTGTVIRDDEKLIERFKSELFTSEKPDRELLLKYMSASAFPGFYSLALPLLKYGVPVRPVLLDNARRFTGYLDDYKVLILSYEFMKPDYPDMNTTLAEWVKQGGTLIYIGDGSDPYHKINSWWTGKYENPACHLFDMLGIKPEKEKEIFNCGSGLAAVWSINPCVFSYNKENADSLREFLSGVISLRNEMPAYKNYLCMKRGNYIIAAVMDESVDEKSLTLDGAFADMFTADFALTEHKCVAPGEKCMLFDLEKIKDEPLAVIGTSVRVNSLTEENGKILLDIAGAGEMRANIRLKVPFAVTKAVIDGKDAAVHYDEKSSTVLVSFDSETGDRKLVLE
ncbi:MAG: hypothetical protein MJ177_01155 [Clostridia bacterium]|nr:hypothetical protein [Clostridia bacterium]